jgi:hypothetical protein
LTKAIGDAGIPIVGSIYAPIAVPVPISLVSDVLLDMVVI